MSRLTDIQNVLDNDPIMKEQKIKLEECKAAMIVIMTASITQMKKLVDEVSGSNNSDITDLPTYVRGLSSAIEEDVAIGTLLQLVPDEDMIVELITNTLADRADAFLH